ncbi:hypothetical protein HMPREF1586_01351 [Gardnerella vaginalis JCP8522]|nr:hypothetical protein HMPREF1586_01351 [Gardnerella vaginalis JCP8522]
MKPQIFRTLFLIPLFVRDLGQKWYKLGKNLPLFVPNLTKFGTKSVTS